MSAVGRGIRQVRVWMIGLAVSAPLAAQTPDSAARATPDSSRAAAPAAPRIDFSGVLFANYQYRTDRGVLRAANKFDLERAYLTFRMPAGEKASVRITADVFQQQQSGSDSYYRGWTLRAKYAFLQYDYLRRGTARGVVRFGLLHNVFIDHDETHWPRWISTVATDRHGYFSSADAGIATMVTFPGRLGEAYATVTNGPGYTSRETDRFKDVAARITLTPLARGGDALLQSLALTAWTYQGAVGSAFANGGAGQVGPIGSSLRRDRWGIFASVKNPVVTLAGQYAARSDAGETGSNTPALPRAVVDSSGSLISVYAMARPFAAHVGPLRTLSLLGRVDNVITNRDRNHRHTLAIAGVTVDLTKAASLSFDYQEQLAREGPATPSKTFFLHLVGRF